MNNEESMGNKLSTMWNLRKYNSPVVVILGATGTGKSKLAIELAEQFNGEIISADSMQVYKGLEIVTNKVSEEEQQQVPHHLIGCLNALKRYTVVDFQNQALPLIHDLQSKRKLPIIVGGTNYYIESLLWDVLIKTGDSSGNTLLLETEQAHLRDYDTQVSSTLEVNLTDSSLLEKGHSEHSNDIEDLFNVKITQDSFEHIPSPVLHKALMEVDQAKALSLHPNDKRKIIRSLQVYQKSQCRHSDLIDQQKSQRGGSTLGGPLCLKNSVMLWVQCQKQVLDQRLDERVDTMIKNGLLNELLEFHKEYNRSRLQSKENPSYKEGIFQCIGFKEFHEYLILSEEEQATEKGKKLLQRGIEDMKIHTRQYARKQSRWITNRFLRTFNREVPPIYGLDATDLNFWEKNVSKVAFEIVKSRLQDEPCPVEPLPVERRAENVPETNYCDICDQVIVGTLTWQIHLKSKSHHRRKASLKKKENITYLSNS